MEKLRVIPVTNTELIQAVNELAHEIWPEHFGPIIGLRQVDYMLDKFLSPKAIAEQINSGYRYYLFSYDYTFAGFAGIRMDKDDKSLFLSKLYVHKDFRGLGISSYMFRQLILLCEKNRLTKIRLTCNRHNTESLAVYEHWGFVKAREEKTDIGGGFFMDDYVMEYHLVDSDPKP